MVVIGTRLWVMWCIYVQELCEDWHTYGHLNTIEATWLVLFIIYIFRIKNNNLLEFGCWLALRRRYDGAEAFIKLWKACWWASDWWNKCCCWATTCDAPLARALVVWMLLDWRMVNSRSRIMFDRLQTTIKDHKIKLTIGSIKLRSQEPDDKNDF